MAEVTPETEASALKKLTAEVLTTKEVRDIQAESRESHEGLATLRTSYEALEARVVEAINARDTDGKETAAHRDLVEAHIRASTKLLEAVGSELHFRTKEDSDKRSGKIDEQSPKDLHLRVAAMEEQRAREQGQFSVGSGLRTTESIESTEAFKKFRRDFAEGGVTTGMVTADGAPADGAINGSVICRVAFETLYGRKAGARSGPLGSQLSGAELRAVQGVISDSPPGLTPIPDPGRIITMPGRRMELIDFLPRESISTTTWTGIRLTAANATGTPTVPGVPDLPAQFGNAGFFLQGDTLPVMDIEFLPVSGPMVSVGQMIHNVSIQAMGDVEGLDGTIQEQLVGGVNQAWTTERLLGPGGVLQVLGVLNSTEVYEWLASVEGLLLPGQAALTDLDRLRGMQNTLVGFNSMPTVAIMSSTQVMNMELLKDSQERHIWSTIGEGSNQRAWRMDILAEPWFPLDVADEQTLMMDPLETLVAYEDPGDIILRVATERTDDFDRYAATFSAHSKGGLNLRRPGLIIKGKFDV